MQHSPSFFYRFLLLLFSNFEAVGRRHEPLLHICLEWPGLRAHKLRSYQVVSGWNHARPWLDSQKVPLQRRAWTTLAYTWKGKLAWQLFIMRSHNFSFAFRCGIGICGCVWTRYAKAANVSFPTYLGRIISVPRGWIWTPTFKTSTSRNILSIPNETLSLEILTGEQRSESLAKLSMQEFFCNLNLSNDLQLKKASLRRSSPYAHQERSPCQHRRVTLFRRL